MLTIVSVVKHGMCRAAIMFQTVESRLPDVKRFKQTTADRCC